MWTQELAVDANFQARGETQEAAEHARYGVVRVLSGLYIPVTRTLPHRLEPFRAGSLAIVYDTVEEAFAFLTRQEAKEARDAE